MVVEDSAACQKTIQTPVAQQVLKTDGAGNLTWTNGASGTILRKDSTGLLEFATLNSVLQSNPVDLGIQPLTTTGAVNVGSLASTGAITTASITATGAITGASAVFSANSSSNAVRITQTGSGDALVVEDSSNPDTTPFIVKSDGKVGIGTTTPTTAMEISTSGDTELRITSSGNQNPTLSLNRASAASWQAVNDLGQLKIQSAGPGIDATKTDRIFMNPGVCVSILDNVGIGTTSPDTDAILHLSSTTKGFLPPKMTTTQKNAISSPPSGLVLYDTTTNKLCVYNGTSWIDLH